MVHGVPREGSSGAWVSPVEASAATLRFISSRPTRPTSPARGLRGLPQSLLTTRGWAQWLTDGAAPAYGVRPRGPLGGRG